MQQNQQQQSAQMYVVDKKNADAKVCYSEQKNTAIFNYKSCNLADTCLLIFIIKHLSYKIEGVGRILSLQWKLSSKGHPTSKTCQNYCHSHNNH